MSAIDDASTVVWENVTVWGEECPPSGCQTLGSFGGESALSRDATHFINGVTVPIIGVLGVVGNLLNLAVLSWRSWRRDDDTLEQVALVGLIALAASDLCFCITIIPNFWTWQPKTFYESRSFSLYFSVYGDYFHNLFIKTSTWLTMIVATARYIAICHPLRARICFGLTPTTISIVSTFAMWAVLLAPMLWKHKIQDYRLQLKPNTTEKTFLIIDLGPFEVNHVLNRVFTYTWALLGYFIPVTILAFCNVCLIRALRASRLLRKTVATGPCRTASSCHRRITITLIALVLMFIVLVSPSEVLYFIEYIHPTSLEHALLACNILQALNFAFHFVLYCAVNVSFRRTMVTLAYVICAFLRHPRRITQSRHSRTTHDSFSGRSTLQQSMLRSNETNI